MMWTTLMIVFGVSLFIENIFTPGINPIASVVAGGLIGAGIGRALRGDD